MQYEIPVTIQKIAQHWAHPRLMEVSRPTDRQALCRMLLPDVYDSTLCADAAGLYLEPGDEKKRKSTALGTATLRKLVTGNRWVQEPGALRPASTTFTRGLIEDLNLDRPVRYLDPKRPSVGCRRNLLDKLFTLVQTSEPPLSADAPLFTRVLPEPDFPGGPGAEVYGRLSRVRDTLLADGSPEALSYAVLILVLVAWLQQRVEELPWLWDRAYIDEYLSQARNARQEQGLERHRPLSSERYFHRYHVYLYRSTKCQLFPAGTLTMARQDGAMPTARLELRYNVGGDPEKLDGIWNYSGRVMISPHDRGAYALMGDESSGAVAYLAFAFTDFRSADMYYRSGLLLTFHPKKKVPQMQKIAIVRAELTGEQQRLVLGTLSVANEEIVLTQAQLERFCTENRDAPWMPQFREHLLPFILRHETRCYCFAQNEITGFSLGELTAADRLRIWMGLKAGAAREGGEFVLCTDPEDLHNLLQ